LDNPVQAEGVAQGKESTPLPYNPVGVEFQTVVHIRSAELG